MLKNVLVFLTGLASLFLSYFLAADSVRQLGSNNYLLVEQYDIVDESLVGTERTREIALVVANLSNEVLRHVYLRIDSSPSHVSSEGKAYFEEIQPGESPTSRTTLIYTVDLARQSGSELEVVWQIEFELGVERMIDEVAVVEPM